MQYSRLRISTDHAQTGPAHEPIRAPTHRRQGPKSDQSSSRPPAPPKPPPQGQPQLHRSRQSARISSHRPAPSNQAPTGQHQPAARAGEQFKSGSFARPPIRPPRKTSARRQAGDQIRTRLVGRPRQNRQQDRGQRSAETLLNRPGWRLAGIGIGGRDQFKFGTTGAGAWNQVDFVRRVGSRQ
jgi:hypothetical protein